MQGPESWNPRIFPGGSVCQSPGGSVCRSPGGSIFRSQGGSICKSPGGSVCRCEQIEARDAQGIPGYPDRPKRLHVPRNKGPAAGEARGGLRHGQEADAATNERRQGPGKLGEAGGPTWCLSREHSPVTPWLRGDDSPLLSVPISDPSFLQSQDERRFLSVESSRYSWVFHFFFFWLFSVYCMKELHWSKLKADPKWLHYTSCEVFKLVTRDRREILLIARKSSLKLQ